MLELQLGALIAAGHSPTAIMDWTWPQIAMAASAVNTYHLDLVSRVATGKSPVLAEAEKKTNEMREIEAIALRLQAQGAQDDEATRAQAENMRKAAEFAALGFSVNIRKA